jgi:type IV pilus assembly protein PilV
MNTSLPFPSKQRGFGMIEVLVALVILLIGLLGLAGLMVQSQRAELESYQRVQALVMLQDMVDRINANRAVASCYAFTDATSGAPYLGSSTAVTPTCVTGSIEASGRAVQDMTDWSNLLLGAAEVSGGSNVGAMQGARGCVSVAATTPPTYRVSVSWQGLNDTAAPALSNCGKNQYGTEAKRRTVTTTLRVATLN